MLTVHPQFITDAEGKKISVILSLEEYEALIEELEDIEDVRLYDQSNVVNDPSIPIDEAFKIIEEERKKKG